ncbi:helix-turn-helix transcriptional regulator [Pasteurella multocida]|uniref:helix-turn-helix domain-containing protein n=1 Tax=Pasteurella multocida TaxID=747 RepID=UPI002C67A90D|nr:helix-turn-helix transcriptional regulator [Pasteurella multocida]MEB3504330.1 helix-turn-helix transcriptional regulator [Pasteurella multocida]
MSISERLKLVCQEKNWKLKDFSEATGLPYRTAQGYLNGTREPNAEGMATICVTTNVNLNWLVTGIGAMFIETVGSSLEEQGEYVHLLDALNKCNSLGKKIIKLHLNSIVSEKMFTD